MPNPLECGRTGCPSRGEPVRSEGLWRDPIGWANVTVTGLPIVNRLLCPSCAQQVRELLGTSPNDLARRSEQDVEAAFARGYDAGIAEPRAVGSELSFMATIGTPERGQ